MSFEFRNYDSRLGRFWSVDPLTEKQPGWSPYKSFLNNPILYVDKEGSTEYITTITTNQKTGETTIEMTTSNWVITDGIRREIKSSGGYYQATNYYDFHTIILRTVGAHGEVIDEVSKSKILYEQKRFSKGFIFSPDDKGSTLPWFTPGGGIHFTANIGQWQETRKGVGDIQNVDINLLLDVINASMNAAGANKAENIGKALNYLLGMIETGSEITDLVQKTIDIIKTTRETPQIKEPDPNEKVEVRYYKKTINGTYSGGGIMVPRKDSLKTATELNKTQDE